MRYVLLMAGLAALFMTIDVRSQDTLVRWEQLPPIPDPEGFAAPFAGVSHGALVVAGGANIPGNKWADKFTKKWYDSVYVLERPDGAWKLVGKLPRPLGYGVCITAAEGVICIGGSDSERHYADVFRLAWVGGSLVYEDMPPLPRPCANACGALVGHTIYVAGGIESPTATKAMHEFWALDLADAKPAWKELTPWPGQERMLAVAGELGGDFYLFSGACLSAGPDGKPVREYLKDAWRYHPGQGWTQLADLPRAAVAAPSPALPMEQSELMIPTGDDGLNVHFEPLIHHPGFPKQSLTYHVAKNDWTSTPCPFSRGTAPVVEWLGHFVVPNGEVMPRVRTPVVWWCAVP